MSAYSRGRFPSTLKRGASGKGSATHPKAHFFRFTVEENDRLTKLVRKRRLTMQAFGHAAIMKALNDADIGKQTEAEEDVNRERQVLKKAPSGFDIKGRLTAPPPDPVVDLSIPISPPVPSPPPLPSPTMLSVDSEIMALARIVTAAPLPERKSRLKDAVRTLMHGRSQEEALRLGDALDAAIRRLDGVPQTALERVRARRAAQGGR